MIEVDINVRDVVTTLAPVAFAWYLQRMDARQRQREDERKEQDRIRTERERMLSDRMEQLEVTLRMLQEQEQERFAREEERIALIEELHDKIHLVIEGVNATIKDRLNQSCTFYIEKQKWVSAPIFETITKMFEVYKKLGGNGGTERLYNEFKTLPLTPPEVAV